MSVFGMILVLAGCTGQVAAPTPSGDARSADPTPEATPEPTTDLIAIQKGACEGRGGMWLPASESCLEESSPSPAADELEEADSSIGLVELTMGLFEPELTFRRDDEVGGPPRWIADHSSGASAILEGAESDDPEFHFLTGMSLNVPYSAAATLGDTLGLFLLAADLATDNEAGDWFREAYAACEVTSCSASRELTLDDSPGRSEDVLLSIESSTLAGVTFSVEVLED